ncbi:hybrid sensor histidine kinase/response regulator [Tabrizicola aquatica]|uniref:hybrid sensor histidine kinase/response regulator n=1 Tax=Tabrizicola aquatica TaxID=909926 RepID=UPI0015E1A9FD|nr:PAS domain-containing hybrid sensor histidine kinase/response regulator [Tabrizicola aquatica]
MAVVGILLCLLTISFLADTVRSEVDALAVANSDTTQWSLVQTEVEVLALQVAVQDALHMAAAPDLQEIRRRFDILYSRIRLIGESQQFAGLRQDPQAVATFSDLEEFIQRQTPVIDGPDDQLIASLPAMAQDLSALRVSVRDYSLLGVRFYADDSDGKREGVARTLAQIGYFTLALVAALLFGIGILMAMFRRSIRSERLAAESRKRLEEIIATSLDGIIVTDADGKVLEYNGAAERVFGYTRSEAIGHDMATLVIPDHLRDAHTAGMKRYRSTGERRVVGKGLVRLEARRKDGAVFPVELSLSAATFGRREIFVSFLRDISERVAGEQELILTRDRAVAGERAKAELLAVMSHEMRTPLNGILGTIELLEMSRLTARQERYVAAMKTSAGLLLHHVNGVLGMSRAESGQLDLKPDAVDPAALIQELVESQRHAIEANGNGIHADVQSAPARIWADPLRLRQVILNLVGNANKFTRSGEIRVECDGTADGQAVEFRVIDTGIGIREEDLERVFEEFRTLDTSYSRKAEGTGLGLAIARRLVRAMGGDIGVDSEPGEGSLFWVRLPIGAPDTLREADRRAALDDASTTAASEETAPLQILLVEDNRINRLVARDMLESLGHQVFEAHDGREGVHIAGLQAFDVILMDISMPELDGVTATGLIRASQGPNRATPVIALTAHALPEDAERFHAAGITETLTKPLSVASLRKTLSGVGQGPDQDPTPRMAGVLAELSAQLGREKAQDLLRTFCREGDDLMQRIAAASWATETPAARADAVHRLAGSAAVFGASALQSALQALETDYRRLDMDGAQLRLDALVPAWNATRQQIDQCLGP